GPPNSCGAGTAARSLRFDQGEGAAVVAPASRRPDGGLEARSRSESDPLPCASEVASPEVAASSGPSARKRAGESPALRSRSTAFRILCTIKSGYLRIGDVKCV